MGLLLETAALLKIDSAPMEGLDPKAYDKILGLEGSGFTTAMTVALGYRASDDQYQHAKKVRYPEKDLIQFV
jgi:nitroreductase